jgi:hypothetical protein
LQTQQADNKDFPIQNIESMNSQKSNFARRRIINILTRGTLGSIGLLIICAGSIAIAGLNDNIDSPQERLRQRADLAVVLGNTVNPNGQPSRNLSINAGREKRAQQITRLRLKLTG